MPKTTKKGCWRNGTGKLITKVPQGYKIQGHWTQNVECTPNTVYRRMIKT